MVWVGRKSLGSSWFRTAFSYESCAKLPWLGGRHLFFVADKATLSTKGSKNSMVSLPEHRRWWNAWTACTSPLARQAFSKSISKSLRRSSRRVSICLHGFHGHFMAISWEFHGNFMGIYGCHVVAPHSIHALAAIGFRLRKLRKLPELWYDLRTDTQINIKIISNSLLLGLWSNSKWLGSGRKLCLNSMIYFRLGTKHQRTLHLLDKSILTETPGAWLFRPPLRLGGWWGNYPNYPQQTSSATHHSLWQLPIFLEWPRAAVALPASRLGPRAMDDEILEDCSGNFG